MPTCRRDKRVQDKEEKSHLNYMPSRADDVQINQLWTFTVAGT